MSSRDPLNHLGSVRTEMTDAPAKAYERAIAGAEGEEASTISPFEGEARLTSARRAMCLPPEGTAEVEVVAGWSR